MKTRFAFVALIFVSFAIFAPLSDAQVVQQVIETFQDDTAGQNPSATWYQYTETSNANFGNPAVASQLGSLLYKMARSTSNAGMEQGRFTFNEPAAINYMEWSVAHCFEGGGNAPLRAQLKNENGLTFFNLQMSVNTNPACSGIVGMRYHSFEQGVTCTVTAGDSTIQTTAGANVKGYVTRFTFDWSLQRITFESTASGDTTVFYCPFSAAATELSAVWFIDIGSLNRRAEFFIDDILIDGLTPGTPSGPPVDSNPVNDARDFFVDSWGFSQEAGNWLFGIATVGMVSTGFFAYGFLGGAVGVILGVGLAVAFGFFELWVLLLLVFLVLAFFATRFLGSGGDE